MTQSNGFGLMQTRGREMINEFKDGVDDGSDMVPELEAVISGEGINDSHILDQDECLIGRAIDAEIQLASASVSRRHARIFRQDGAWFIEDLGSRHGTEVGGAGLNPTVPSVCSPVNGSWSGPV
jgi:pSer/pThr/pTyr-binding forkhead associated (FHA) protein